MSKVVLITGCRSGFGLLSALTAAKAGHTVYAGVRDLGAATELRRVSEGLAVVPLQLDVTEAEERSEAIKRISADHGRLDVLVNNAGVALGGFLELVEEDELRHVFEVNVFGVWSMTKEALPLLRESRGLIVQLSSLSGRMAFPGLGVYSSSKFALEGMSEALRAELQPLGVRVVLLEPGAYRTDIFGRNRAEARGMARPGPYEPQARALERGFTHLVDRIAADPQEVADAILAQVEGRGPRRLRVPMGPSSRARTLALRVLPHGLIERVVRYILSRQ